MNVNERKQLERRIAQIDDAITSLRRGFVRQGARPPRICELLQKERSEMVERLEREAARETACASWSLPPRSEADADLSLREARRLAWRRNERQGIWHRGLEALCWMLPGYSRRGT